MQKILFILLTFISINNLAKAQSANSNTVFFEVGGPGLASFNYDTRFTKTSTGWGGRIGIGGFGDRDESVITIPIGINFITSGDNRNFFEVGINHTFVKAEYPIFDFGNFNSISFSTLNFGYRKQPIKNGFVFRAAVNPIITNGSFNPFYFGIAFGYKF